MANMESEMSSLKFNYFSNKIWLFTVVIKAQNFFEYKFRKGSMRSEIETGRREMNKLQQQKPVY